MKKTTGRKRHSVFTACLLILWLSAGIAFGASSINYTLKSDVLSGGGGDMGSTNYDLFSTTGQPTAIGKSSSTNYADFAGFWYQVGELEDACIAPILQLLLLE